MPIIRTKFKEIYIENAPDQSPGWTWKGIENLRNNDGKLCELRPVNEPFTFTGQAKTVLKSPYIVLKGFDKTFADVFADGSSANYGGYDFFLYAKFKYENFNNLKVRTSINRYVFPDGTLGDNNISPFLDQYNIGIETQSSALSGREVMIATKLNKTFIAPVKLIKYTDLNSPDSKIVIQVEFLLNNFDSRIHTFGFDYFVLDVQWVDKYGSYTTNFLNVNQIERTTPSTRYPSARPLPGFNWNNINNALNDQEPDDIYNIADYNPPTPYQFDFTPTDAKPGLDKFFYTDFLRFSNINFKMPSTILNAEGNLVPTNLVGMVFRYRKRGFRFNGTFGGKNRSLAIDMYDDTIRVHDGTQFIGKNNLVPKNINSSDIVYYPWRANTDKPDFGTIPRFGAGLGDINNQTYGTPDDNWNLPVFTPATINNNNFGIAVAGVGYFYWWNYINEFYFPYRLGIDYADVSFYFEIYDITEYISVWEGIYEKIEYLPKHELKRLSSNLISRIFSQEEIKKPNILADQAFISKILESQEKLEKHTLIKFGVLTNKKFDTNERLGNNLLKQRLYLINKILQSDETLSKLNRLNRPEVIESKLLDKKDIVGLSTLYSRSYLIQKVLDDSNSLGKNKIETNAVISPKGIDTDEQIRRVFVDIAVFPTQRILDVRIPASQEEVNTNTLLYIPGQTIEGVNDFQSFENVEYDNSADSINYNWTNVSNLANFADGSFAEISWVNNSQTEPSSNNNYINTDYLIVKNPNPSDIPDNAVIYGIRVFINKFGSNFIPNGYRTEDLEVKLTLNGNYIGENKAKTNEAWPNKQEGFQVSTYGSVTDKWGTNLTGSDVKNASFGVALRARFKYGSLTQSDFVALSEKYNVAVDYIGISFTYYIPLPNIQPKVLQPSEQMGNKVKLSITATPIEGCLNLPFQNFENQAYTEDGDLTARYIWTNESGAKSKGDDSASSIEKLEP